MSTTSEQVLQAALALPPIDRAELAEALYASIGASPDATADAQWATEAEDRLAAYDRGAMGAALADDVFARLNARAPR